MKEREGSEGKRGAGGRVKSCPNGINTQLPALDR